MNHQSCAPCGLRTYWQQTDTSQVFPATRNAHSIGPGIEVRDNGDELRRQQELDRLTALE